VDVGFAAVEERVREDWKCVRRSWVVFVRAIRAGMSARAFEAAVVEEDFGDMVAGSGFETN
jgi:hypothetical protein